MTLIRDDDSLEPSWLERMCARIIQVGPIPRHVAFIMDGNRRFAAKKHVERIEGHTEGFNKLAHTLKWCQDIGVEEVTVYAFSAENFKRTKEEVDSLMELARQKFSAILDEKEKLSAHGVRINVVGELHMLPLDIQQIAGKLYNMTKMNSRCKLNICIAYTSRLEMAQAMKDLACGIKNGFLKPEDVTQDLISKTLEVPAVDLLIRTSGEIRLSDYLLWQSSFSYLSFLQALWPEFSIWEFYGAIFQYQRSYSNVHTAQINSEKFIRNETDHELQQEKEQRIQNFLVHLKVQRDCYYNNLSNGIGDNSNSKSE